MVKNAYQKALNDVKKILDKFNNEWTLTAAFVYTTPDGFLQFLGSQAVGDVLQEHHQDIMHHPAYSHQVTEEDPDFVPAEAANRVNMTLNPQGEPEK